jgi:hypothetical protein
LSASSTPSARREVTLVVVTRDRPELFRDWALPGLLQATRDDWQVLVIDQSTGRDTRNLCNAAQIPVATGPSGLSRGRNLALRQAVTPIVVFTDDDISFEATFLEHMWRGFQTSANVGAVLGRGRWPHGALMPGGTAGLHSWPVNPFTLGSGYNYAVRVEACLDVGGFDVDLGPGARFAGADDTEMLIALLLAGHVVVCTDASVVTHPEWRTHRQEISRQFGYGAGTAVAVQRHWRSDAHLLAFAARRLLQQAARVGSAARRLDLATATVAVAYLAGFASGSARGAFATRRSGAA